MQQSQMQRTRLFLEYVKEYISVKGFSASKACAMFRVSNNLMTVLRREGYVVCDSWSGGDVTTELVRKVIEHRRNYENQEELSDEEKRALRAIAASRDKNRHEESIFAELLEQVRTNQSYIKQIAKELDIELH